MLSSIPTIPIFMIKENIVQLKSRNNTRNQKASTNVLYWSLIHHFITDFTTEALLLKCAKLAETGNVIGLRGILREHFNNAVLTKAITEAFISLALGFYMFSLKIIKTKNSMEHISKFASNYSIDPSSFENIPMNPKEVKYDSDFGYYTPINDSSTEYIIRYFVGTIDLHSERTYIKPIVHFDHNLPNKENGAVLYILKNELRNSYFDVSPSVALRFFSVFVESRYLLDALRTMNHPTINHFMEDAFSYHYCPLNRLDNTLNMSVLKEVQILVWNSFGNTIENHKYSQSVLRGYNINSNSDLLLALKESRKKNTCVNKELFYSILHICHSVLQDISVVNTSTDLGASNINIQNKNNKIKLSNTYGIHLYRHKLFFVRFSNIESRCSNSPQDKDYIFLKNKNIRGIYTDVSLTDTKINCIECMNLVNFNNKNTNRQNGIYLYFINASIKKTAMITGSGFLKKPLKQYIKNSTEKRQYKDDNKFLSSYLSWVFNLHCNSFKLNEEYTGLINTSSSNEIIHDKMVYITSDCAKIKSTGFLTNAIYISFLLGKINKHISHKGKKFVLETQSFSNQQVTFSTYSTKFNSTSSPVTINIRGGISDFLEAFITYKLYNKIRSPCSHSELVKHIPNINKANCNYCFDFHGVTNTGFVPDKFLREYPHATKSINFPAIKYPMNFEHLSDTSLNIKNIYFNENREIHHLAYSVIYKTLTFMIHKMVSKSDLMEVGKRTIQSIHKLCEVDLAKNSVMVQSERTNHYPLSNPMSRILDTIMELIWLLGRTNQEYSNRSTFILEDPGFQSTLCYSTDIISGSHSTCTTRTMGTKNLKRLSSVIKGRSFMKIDKNTNQNNQKYNKNKDKTQNLLLGHSSLYKSRSGNFISCCCEYFDNNFIHKNSAIILEAVTRMRKIAMIKGHREWHTETIQLYEEQLYKYYN